MNVQNVELLGPGGGAGWLQVGVWLFGWSWAADAGIPSPRCGAHPMALRVHVALACLLPKAQLSLVCFVCVFVCVCVLRVLHVFECTQLVCGGISYVVPFYLVTNCVCVCVCCSHPSVIIL